MERTKVQVSIVQERTVSVRPSRNKRVMEASYVKQNFPLSCWENLGWYENVTPQIDWMTIDNIK